MVVHNVYWHAKMVEAFSQISRSFLVILYLANYVWKLSGFRSMILSKLTVAIDKMAGQWLDN